jgi:hypothetical protein
MSVSLKNQVNENIVQLPGRNVCGCQAQKHDLINNCLKCGRVVCKQEGSGPCLFCGHLVCTKDEQEVLNRGSKKSDQLLKKLTNSAEIHKNTLLEYDRTSEKRTRVIDDESDYFSVDSDKWLTPEQRQKLKEREAQIRDQRHGSRLNQRFTFDFAGRTVMPDNAETYDPSKDSAVQKIMDNSKLSAENLRANFLTGLPGLSCVSVDSEVANPNVMRPTLVNEDGMAKYTDKVKGLKTTSELDVEQRPNWRIQDAELQIMCDDGWCLSMHQPWASYLVHGIKKHEGRNWYSPHRGRLWIHAASKVPSDEEIATVQQMHIAHYGE